jgi:hypothetical protein
MVKEVPTFPGRLGIQHRDVPYAILNNIANGGLIFSRPASYFAREHTNQAVGRNQGFRKSEARDTKTIVISSSRLFKSVISKLSQDRAPRTLLYPTAHQPW